MRSSFSRTARQLSRDVRGLQSRQCRVQASRFSSIEGGHKWSTPLAKQLAQIITATGPIPVASFMRQCLTSDLGGYYTRDSSSEADQFGAKGDFVTSPEISQVFGELVGIWTVAEWIAQGKRSEGVYLMEMGPGRGTLMDDVMRTIKNFPQMAKAIEAVYMVEASQQLREAQHRLLCGENALVRNDVGYESVSKHSADLKVIWAEDLRLIPRDGAKTPFIIAHEFFDALPIHVFQSVPPTSPSAVENETLQTPTGPIPAPRRLPQASQQHQWRELVVTPKPPHRLEEGEPEFEMSLAKAATPHSMYLPETSPRYQALKSITDATMEISPESQAYVRDLAERLGGSNPEAKAPLRAETNASRVQSGQSKTPIRKVEPSGAALIIDYGPSATIPANSLRGIRAHKRISPFDSPGATDVSADVDFLGLAESAINASPGVEVHGPVDQARFLTAMGIEERAAQLVKRAVDKERSGSTGQGKSELTELVKRIEGGWKRLVDQSPQGMGRLYQVMAIIPHKLAKDGETRRRPVGFGGDVHL